MGQRIAGLCVCARFGAQEPTRNERGLYGAGFTLPSGKGARPQCLRQRVPARLQCHPVTGFDVTEAPYLLRQRSESNGIRQGCRIQAGQSRLQRGEVMRLHRTLMAALGGTAKRIEGAAA